MKTRQIKDLLIILLKFTKKSRTLTPFGFRIKSKINRTPVGLCYLLRIERIELSVQEIDTLKDYIQKCAPVYKNTPWCWRPGAYRPRVKWLKKQIKLNS